MSHQGTRQAPSQSSPVPKVPLRTAGRDCRWSKCLNLFGSVSGTGYRCPARATGTGYPTGYQAARGLPPGSRAPT
jgi:hypothetical protein